MNVGIIGTGAIAWKHAQAYQNIGYRITACTDRTEEKGRKFCDVFGAAFVATPEQLSQRSDVDYLDVCTFPAYRLAARSSLARRTASMCWCRSRWRSTWKRPRI